MVSDQRQESESTSESSAHVEVRDVKTSFGRRVVFDGLSCGFSRGNISVVMGGSGTGKSTLLRMLGGLQKPDKGEIVVAGTQIVGLRSQQLNEVRSGLGMLFQSSALLDSMSVFENVALPLREHRDFDEAQIGDAVHRRLEAVGLSDVDELLPASLSGGMLKRVALARAIVNDPDILLCDEPFSGLDPLNVSRIEALLTHLNRELGLTIIVSSHHVASSLRMGHQLVLLRDGGAIAGAPLDLVRAGDERLDAFLGAEGAELARRGSNSADATVEAG